MKEEILLEKTFGKLNLFKVPDGYFDNINTSIMDQISKQAPSKTRPITKYLRPIIYAACITVSIVISTIYFYHTNKHNVKHIANVSYNNDSLNSNSDITFEQMYDYAMFDNDDLYSFIADEQ